MNVTREKHGLLFPEKRGKYSALSIPRAFLRCLPLYSDTTHEHMEPSSRSCKVRPDTLEEHGKAGNTEGQQRDNGGMGEAQSVLWKIHSVMALKLIGRTVFSTDFPSLVKEKSKHAHLETKKPRLREILNLRRMLT